MNKSQLINQIKEIPDSYFDYSTTRNGVFIISIRLHKLDDASIRFCYEDNELVYRTTEVDSNNVSLYNAKQFTKHLINDRYYDYNLKDIIDKVDKNVDVNVRLSFPTKLFKNDSFTKKDIINL